MKITAIIHSKLEVGMAVNQNLNFDNGNITTEINTRVRALFLILEQTHQISLKLGSLQPISLRVVHDTIHTSQTQLFKENKFH